MIITNREEVIDKAFGVFVRMNYEKASIITLAKACGVTKTGIVYYFPHKLDLFMAVADKYVLQMHEPENKFAAPADTLTEFIGQYVAGVAASMKRIVELIGDNSSRMIVVLTSTTFISCHKCACTIRVSGRKLRKSTDKTMTYGRKSYRRQKKAGKSGATRT